MPIALDSSEPNTTTALQSSKSDQLTAQPIPDNYINGAEQLEPKKVEQSPPKSVKQKMSKKEKRFMWAGIILIIPVILFVLFFILFPHITALIRHCNIDFSGNSTSCGSTNAAFVFLSIPIGIFIAVPLTIIGSLFLLYSILSWKKIKSPGLTAFLSVLLGTIILVLLAFGFVSVLAVT